MMIEKEETLERALIVTVETELTVMQSFCSQQFPCDVATTVAMRMSRAVVSAICRLGEPAPDSANPVLSADTKARLLMAQESLADLNRQFELRLSTLPPDALEWKTWTA